MERIFGLFAEAGYDLYLVGGAVRDRLLGVEDRWIGDLDFCTNARPEASLALLRAAGWTTYDVGIAYGTVGTVLRGPAERGYPKDCQITTYRSAEYYRRGSRHPEVVWGDTIEQDLARRDFSINSIAQDARGDLVDPYEGRLDLERRTLRVVGDPHETLAEDPLRTLRVARFMAKLDFKPDAPLIAACRARVQRLAEISRERWSIELDKLVRADYPARGLTFLREHGALPILSPGHAALDAERWGDLMARLEAGADSERARRGGRPLWCAPLPDPERARFARWALASMPLGADGARRWLAELKSSRALQRAVSSLIEHAPALARARLPASDVALRRLARAAGPYWGAQLDLARALEPERSEAWDELERRAAALDEAGQLYATLAPGFGREVMELLDLPASPLIGEVKAAVEERIVDGIFENGWGARAYIDGLRRDPPPRLAQVLASYNEQGETR